MKRVMAILTCTVLAGGMAASADIIAGWDAWSGGATDTYAPTLTSGVSAVAVGTAPAGETGWANWGGSATHNFGASIDGTWGTIADSAPSTAATTATHGVGLLNATSSGELTITIQNTSGSFLDLTGFHFDGIGIRPGAAESWTLSILAGSAVTQGAVQSGVLSTDATSPFLDRDDVDIDFAGLADRRLENGESVIFELAFTGGAGTGAGGNNAMIDNLAVTAIPEPSTMALVAVMGGGLFLLRRRYA